MPSHPYPTSVSMTMTDERSRVPTLSAIATMLAVPPIQVPESAANSFHTSGLSMNWPTARNATGPPTTIPSVPTRSMTRASRPRLAIARRSIVIMSRNSAIGSRT